MNPLFSISAGCLTMFGALGEKPIRKPIIFLLGLFLIVTGFLDFLGAKPLPPQLQKSADKDDLSNLNWISARQGAGREKALRAAGGTIHSEAAVVRGLQWLAHHQSPDGSWKIDGNFKDKGTANDTAGTAFGLLPFLGAGMTHKIHKDNPYHKQVENGLLFLIRKQDKKTGHLGGGMYAHGLAALALCEAYGLTQDPNLRRTAQMAVNYIVKAQHEGGGWRYAPGQAGDTSVTGWQVSALDAALKAGLDVPAITQRKAQRFLDSTCDMTDEGYGYTGPLGTMPTTSAIGLLCRHYLQGWDDKNPRWIKGIDKFLVPSPPGTRKNHYHFYYATQVMRLRGGDAWKTWNEKLREDLIKTQDKENGPNLGSWNSAGDSFSTAGGRLMATSLAILNLQVYYRVWPAHEKLMRFDQAIPTPR